MGVAEPLKDALPLLDAEAPVVSEAVGEAEIVLFPLTVLPAVAEFMTKLVALFVPVGEVVV